MRRTVKAWGLVVGTGGTLLVKYARLFRCNVANEVPSGYLDDKNGKPFGRIVPVTITYNDARPAPKRRKKGGRRA